MDALAAYGSDDDSDSSRDSEPPTVMQSSVTLAAGLVDYSDSSDDEGDATNAEELQPVAADNNDKATGLRQRERASEEVANNNIHNILLPPPPLSDSSMVHWMIDYSEKYRAPSGASSSSSTFASPQVMEKLAKLRQRKSNVSWAKQLKAQQEFHNPHFFQSVVSHFGIDEPLGTASCQKHERFQPFEFNLVAAEEQARIRQNQERES